MIDTYIPTKGKRRKESLAVAEMIGWQIQYAGIKNEYTHVFRVVDVRDQKVRIYDPMAPSRRVWEVSYNHKTGKVTGPHAAALNDFYPQVMAWTKETLPECWVALGLQPISKVVKKAGG